MRPPRAPRLLAAATVAAAVCAPAAAHADWTPPAALAAPAAEMLDSAGNDGGSQMFVWLVTSPRHVRAGTRSGQASYVRMRSRTAHGRLGRTRIVSATGRIVANPQVAIDAAGNAVAVWTQAGRHLRIMGAYRPRGTRFGRPFVIGRTGAFHRSAPQVAMSRSGATVVAWQTGRNLRLARRPAGRCRATRGCFSGAQSFPGGADHALVMTPGGRAFVAWAATTRRGGRPRIELRLTIAAAGRRFGHSIALSSGASASQSALGVAADGTLAIAWRASPPAGGEQDQSAPILATIRRPDGTLTGPQSISAQLGSRPHVAFNRQGEAILVCSQTHPTLANPDGLEVAVAVRAAGGGAFGPARRISPADVAAGSPSLAVDGDGNALLVYSAALPVPGAEGTVAVATLRPTGGDFGPAELLPRDFNGARIVASGPRLTAISAGSGGRTSLSDFRAAASSGA